MALFKTFLLVPGLGSLIGLAFLTAAAAEKGLSFPDNPNGGARKEGENKPGKGSLPVFATKSAVETPTKSLIISNTGPARSGTARFVNPKVEPGKVRWHADFAVARAASVKSKKPVLLFHLMGQLDDKFC